MSLNERKTKKLHAYQPMILKKQETLLEWHILDTIVCD